MSRSFKLKHSTVSTFALVAVLALSVTTPSAAKPRPTVDSSDTCWNGGSTDKGCGGLICWCCYDEGCWICNSDTYDCVWDGRYRAGANPSKAVDPPPHRGNRPPWSAVPNGGIETAPPPEHPKE
jgi:hypothetical protein